jgi:Tol biopolymer transport system component
MQWKSRAAVIGVWVLLGAAVSYLLNVMVPPLLSRPRDAYGTAEKQAPTMPSGVMLMSDGKQIFVPDGTRKCYLTSDGNFNTDASWSYDGKKIVYLLSPHPESAEQYEIWTMAADGSDKKRLPLTSPPYGGALSAFSPDGTKIVYSDHLHSGGGFDSGQEVWVMNSDASDQHQLTETSKGLTARNHQTITWSRYPSYSPDGRKIVYASTTSGNSQIWVMDADGRNKTQLTFPTYVSAPDANAPSWSPDGRKIVFWAGYATKYGEVWVMNADGTGRVQLSHEPNTVNSDNPIWSPDGTSIIFGSDRLESYPFLWKLRRRGPRNWIMNADGSDARLLYPGYPYGRRPWRDAPMEPGTLRCESASASSRS